MSGERGRVESRVGIPGALLLAAYLGVLAALVPASYMAGVGNGSATGGGSSLPASGGASVGASARVVGWQGGDTSPSATAEGPTPSAAPSPASSQPTTGGTPSPTPSSTPRPRPTGRPNREPKDPYRVYRVPILTYHRVVPVSEAGNSLPSLVVAPENFAAQMKAFFDAGWHSITMATLAERMETDTTIPPKTFVITFDDGWYDGYYYAFPIMRRYGFVATFFVVSSRIDRPGALAAWQLRALEAAGDEIGNHTENHTSLSRVPGTRVISEVETGSEEIERAVGHRPVSLCYPMGGVSPYVVSLVGTIPDLKTAVSTGYGWTESWFQRYDMPRIRVRPTTDAASLLEMFNS